MATKISSMPAASSLGVTDLFEIEQSGVSKNISIQRVNELAYGFYSPVIPSPSDVISSTGSSVAFGVTPRWRVLNRLAFNPGVPAASDNIAFPGGAPVFGINRKATDYFSIGSPVRVEIGSGVFFYGICDYVDDLQVNIAGMILPIVSVISLAVGTSDMVKRIRMMYSDVTYNTSTTLVLTKGCQYLWRGPVGYLATYSCAHMNTSNSISVHLQLNGGSNVTVSGVNPPSGTATTYGSFLALNDGINASRAAIYDKQLITAKTSTITGLGDYLIIDMVFVIP